LEYQKQISPLYLLPSTKERTGLLSPAYCKIKHCKIFSLHHTTEVFHLKIKPVVKGFLSTFRALHLISDKVGEFNYVNLRLIKSKKASQV